jgi:uncharacterized protein involved in exopolysaccharide biosynthesis
MSVQDRQLLGINESQNAAATTLHLIFRFLRTVRLRSGILVASLILAGIAGAAYYITAERIYESRASLLIVRIGTGVTEENSANNGNPINEMPTFIELMSKDEVINLALKRLPEKYRTDFKGRPTGCMGEDSEQQPDRFVSLQHEHPGPQLSVQRS